MAPPDHRFSRPLKDFRELKDNDPYSSIFGERQTVASERLGVWRTQFERENEGIVLPYERDGFMKRLMPNRLVKWGLKMKADGPQRVWPVFIILVGSLAFVFKFRSQWYKPKEQYRDVNEVR